MFYYPIPFALYHSPHCTSQLYILHLLYSTCTTHPLPVCLCLMQYAFQHQQWPKCDFDKVMIGERSNQHHFLLCKGGSTTAIATPTSPNQPRCPTLRTPSPPTQCSNTCGWSHHNPLPPVPFSAFASKAAPPTVEVLADGTPVSSFSCCAL